MTFDERSVVHRVDTRLEELRPPCGEADSAAAAPAGFLPRDVSYVHYPSVMSIIHRLSSLIRRLLALFEEDHPAAPQGLTSCAHRVGKQILNDRCCCCCWWCWCCLYTTTAPSPGNWSAKSNPQTSNPHPQILNDPVLKNFVPPEFEHRGLLWWRAHTHTLAHYSHTHTRTHTHAHTLLTHTHTHTHSHTTHTLTLTLALTLTHTHYSHTLTHTHTRTHTHTLTQIMNDPELKNFVPPAFEHRGLLWWRSQLARFVFRPKKVSSPANPPSTRNASVRVVHLRWTTCHAISGRRNKSTTHNL